MKKEQRYDPKELGARIKERRLELNLSMQDVADRLGVNKSTIQRYEANGVTPGRNYLLISLSEALETNTGWLVGETDERKGDNITKIRLMLEASIKIYLDTIQEGCTDERGMILVTGMLQCIIDMMGLICCSFGKATEEIRQINNDAGLEEALAPYPLSRADLAEMAYRQHMEGPVGSLSDMVDCILHMEDASGVNYFELLYRIRNAATGKGGTMKCRNYGAGKKKP